MKKMHSREEILNIVKNGISSGEIPVSSGTKLYKHTFVQAHVSFINTYAEKFDELTGGEKQAWFDSIISGKLFLGSQGDKTLTTYTIVPGPNFINRTNLDLSDLTSTTTTINTQESDVIPL